MAIKTSLRTALSSKFAKVAIAIVFACIVAWLVISINGKDQKTDNVVISNVPLNNLSSSNSVKVTGKVAAIHKSELGFDRVGVVEKIFKEVGDKVSAGEVIVTLNSSEESAAIDSAAATLAVEESNLRELERGLRTEEYSVERSKVVSANVDLNDANLVAQHALKSAYVSADKAVHSYVGTFFANSYQPYPDFLILTRNQLISRNLSAKITEVNTMFENWKKQAGEQAFYDNALGSLRLVRSNLQTIKEFFVQVESSLSALTTNNSNYSVDTISGYLSTMNSANEVLNTAISEVIDAEGKLLAAISALDVAKNEFVLKRSGSSSENLDAARAKVDKARADLSSARAQFAKKRIVSPIDGLVSKLDIEVGEPVALGEAVVSVIDDSRLKIEVFVPEVDIVNVQTGKEATITLDAYGPDIEWKATVGIIDPAETIVEGVSTYKVTLYLLAVDPRIKPGMTANIEITDSQK